MRTFEFCVVALPRRTTSRQVAYWIALTVALLGMALSLAGCGSRQGSEGKGSPMYKGPDPIPHGGGVYKVGNPYEIYGRTYYPKVEPDYERTGVASWYGPKFHRRMTANGEWFDQERITAAHNTMPLPSFAQVTNLKTGKSIIVRVNDRGPYAHDRIIDLSKRSAELLDFRVQGTAPVRVKYLGPAPLNGDDYYVAQAKMDRTKVARAGKQNYARATVEPSSSVLHTGSVGKTVALPAGAARLFVQAGTFGNPDNAARAGQRLASLGAVETVTMDAASGPLYQVRVGPLSGTEEAGQVLSQVIAAGHRDARLIEH
jgi:rare lipoprotein A